MIESKTNQIKYTYRYFNEKEFKKFITIDTFQKFPIPLDIVASGYKDMFVVSSDKIQYALFKFDWKTELFNLIEVMAEKFRIEAFEREGNPLIRDARDKIKLYDPINKEWLPTIPNPNNQ